VGYYLAVKKNEIISVAEKWMELEIIIKPKRPNIACCHFLVESRHKMTTMIIIIGLEGTKGTGGSNQQEWEVKGKST
jgi:hypothetical protein